MVTGQGVHFRYGKRPVLAGLDFEVPAKALTIVAGNNGGGKTTLLKLIAGGLKPKQGSITKTTDLEKRQIYLPAFNLLDANLTLTSQSNQLKSLEGFSEEGFFAHCRALSTLAEPDQRLKTLSSGTLRKVHLAAVFAFVNKDFILIDELDELLDEDSLPLLARLMEGQITARKTIVATLQHTHWLEGFGAPLNRIRLTKPVLANV